MSLRIYVGGLPPQITKDELKERFSKLSSSKVTDVTIQMCNLSGLCRGFGYVTIDGNEPEADFETYQKLYHGAKWKGNKLVVQLAKPTYRQKLEEEWSAETTDVKAPIVVQTDEQIKMKSIFCGRKLVFDENYYSTLERMSSVAQAPIVEKAIIERIEKPIISRVEMEENNEKFKKESNERRLAAIERRKYKKNESIGRISIDQSNSKKIVFSMSDDDEAKPAPTKSSSTDWLDDSENEDVNDDNVEEMFRLRDEFSGLKGKKLFQMQQRFGGDDRFRLDKRFVDDEFKDQEGDDDNSFEQQSVQNGPSESHDMEESAQDETSRAFSVLQQLFPGMSTITKDTSESKEKSLKQRGWNGELKRYDPNSGVNLESEDQLSSELPEPESSHESHPPQKFQPCFETDSTLNSLFTRVRSNSEDGIAGEAALDGFVTSTDPQKATFKVSSIFDSAFEHDDTQSVHSENSAGTSVDDDMDTTTEVSATTTAGVESVVVVERKARKQKCQLNRLVELGATFSCNDDDLKLVEDAWDANRERLWTDCRRKHKDALKNKKGGRPGKRPKLNVV